MPELKCQECDKIIGHQWGDYIQKIGNVLCVECYAKRKVDKRP